jgi:hypothetical protein
VVALPDAVVGEAGGDSVEERVELAERQRDAVLGVDDRDALAVRAGGVANDVAEDRQPAA